MNLKPNGPDVYLIQDPVLGVGKADVERLKDEAQQSPRKRARVCLHLNLEEKIHEMLIVLAREVYIRPHRHQNKIESYHIVEGRANLIIFNETGKIDRIIAMGNALSGLTFFCRVPKEQYHAFLLLSDFLVFHETTSGPFDRSETQPALWAPLEKDITAIKIFLEKTRRDVNTFFSSP